MFEIFQKTVLQCHLSQIIQILIFAVIFVGSAAGQYGVDQWTADNGLPQNSIYGIKQTRDGYLWMATLDGLARFDGVRFTIFNKSNSPGIVNNRFTSLFEAENGDLWAGTEESGVIRYHQGKFTSYGVESGLGTSVLDFSFGDTNENPLALLGNFEISRFSNEKFSKFNGVMTSLQIAPISKPKSIPIFCSADLNKRQFMCLAVGQPANFLTADDMPSLAFISAVQDVDGTIWILTDAGLVHLDKGKVTKVYTEQDVLPENPLFLLCDAGISLVSKDKKGGLWLMDLKTFKSKLLTQQPTETLTNIHARFEDREGNLWFGTISNGLFRFRKQVITAYSKADGLLSTNIYPIFEDRMGVVWIGTTKGVFKYENGIFSLVKTSENFTVDAFGEDNSGRLIVSSLGTLYVLEDDQFKSFYTSQLGVNWAIHTDRDNALWVGSQNGLVRLKDNITTTFTTKEGLAGDNVKVIIESQDKGLWIGTYGGLTHYKDRKFKSWTEKDGLQSLTIRSLI